MHSESECDPWHSERFWIFDFGYCLSSVLVEVAFNGVPLKTVGCSRSLRTWSRVSFRHEMSSFLDRE